jgi:hypothetical protein
MTSIGLLIEGDLLSSPVVASLHAMASALAATGASLCVGTNIPPVDAQGLDIRPVLCTPAGIRGFVESAQLDVVAACSLATAVLARDAAPAMPLWLWLLDDGELNEFRAERFARFGRGALRRRLLDEVFPDFAGILFSSEASAGVWGLHRYDVVPLPVDYVRDRQAKQVFSVVDLRRGGPRPLRVGACLPPGSRSERERASRSLAAYADKLKALGLDLEFVALDEPRHEDGAAPAPIDHVQRWAGLHERSRLFRELDVLVALWSDVSSCGYAHEAARVGTVVHVRDGGALAEASPFVFQSIDQQTTLLRRYCEDRSLLLSHSRLTYRLAERGCSASEAAIALLAAFRTPSPARPQRSRISTGAQIFADRLLRPLRGRFEGFLEGDRSRLIDGAYRLALGRPADASGVFHFQAYGAGPQDVVRALVDSDEYRERFPSRSRRPWLLAWSRTFGIRAAGARSRRPGVKLKLADKSGLFRPFVDRRALPLLELPRPSETAADVERICRLTPSQFVAEAYRWLLDRDPDGAGLKGKLDRIAGGDPYQAILLDILESQEFENIGFAPAARERIRQAIYAAAPDGASSPPTQVSDTPMQPMDAL